VTRWTPAKPLWNQASSVITVVAIAASCSVVYSDGGRTIGSEVQQLERASM
jgi:hypothetical protein